MTRNMQQEGVGLVLLPRPASLVRSPVLPCVEAPLGESDVPLADAGGEKPTGAAALLVDAGGEKPTGAAGAHVLGGAGRGGVATGSVSADLITDDTGLMRARGLLPWFLALCRSGCAAGCCPEDAGSNPLRQASRRGIRGGHAAPVGRRYW